MEYFNKSLDSVKIEDENKNILKNNSSKRKITKISDIFCNSLVYKYNKNSLLLYNKEKSRLYQIYHAKTYWHILLSKLIIIKSLIHCKR